MSDFRKAVWGKIEFDGNNTPYPQKSIILEIKVLVLNNFVSHRKADVCADKGTFSNFKLV